MKILKAQKNGKYQINDVSEEELKILNNVFRFSPEPSYTLIGTSLSLTELMYWMEYSKTRIKAELKIIGNTFEITQWIETPNHSVCVKSDIVDAHTLRNALTK